ncbi:Collagenase containing a C-terminal secretion signal [Tenacibaculum aestuariivivum]
MQVHAQTKHACKASEQNEIYFQKHPESKKEYQEFNKFTKKYKPLQKQSKGVASNYTIPVVFHVYGKTQNGKTVTTEIIQTALQKLNDDFQGLNADFNDVDPYFNPIKSTLSIEFKLAKLDPNGNCTTGVVFYDERSGYGNGGGYDTQIGNDAWDNYKYMNVYIQADLYADGSTTNSGVAWYPNTSMSNNNTARVVYNGAYLHGNTGVEFASVLTHEFGHYLNLIHTFDGGCTYPNDEVSDTPPEDASTVGANCSPITNCEGNFVNYENYMGYNGAADGCYRMFTRGQTDRMLAALQHPARQTLWQYQNLIDTGVNSSGASFSINNNVFKESISNNGTINQTAIITLNGADFSSSNATLTPGTDYNLNLPQGLTASIQTSSYTTAYITISGSAYNHTMFNNQTLNLNFNSSALYSAQNLACSSVSLKLSFYDPFEIIYENITDVSADSSTPWQFFSLPKINGDGSYGAWQYAANHLKIETYGKKLVTNSSSRNISLLNYNQLISTASNFTEPGAYPDQLDLRTTNYTTWDGQTQYVGFSATHNNEPVHGWMRVYVSSDGNTMIVTEYAFSTKPNGDILAGQTTLNDTPISVNAPSNLTSTANSSSAITLNWSDNSNNEEGFKIERLNENGNFTEIASIGANISSYTNTGLTANTSYSYRVRAFLETSNSEYSNTSTTTTSSGSNNNYCTITGNSSYEHIKSVAFNNFTNSSGLETNGYGNYTNQTINLTTGQTVNVNLTPGFSESSYTEHWAIFIDYNNNNTFEASERVLDNLSGNNSVSGNFTVNNTATGTSRMRVIMKYNSNPVDACTTIGDGEAEDYTVKFSGKGNTNYCEITGNSSYEYIQSVSIGNFTNTSSANPNGYSDYTNQTINLTAGSTTNISLTPGFSSSSYTEYWAVFIDYNNNNTFEASERVLNNISGDGTVTGNFLINNNASGTSRMRVIMKYNSTPTDACTTIGDGEAEDYTVNFSGQSNTPTLDTPTNISSAGTYSTGFYAAWGSVSGATNYEVQLLSNGNWLTKNTSSTYYLWIEKQNAETNYTFRVRATNFNENSLWSTPLNVSLPNTGPESKNSKEYKLSIYPNPTTDYINIENTNNENIVIQLYSLEGKKVGEYKNKNRFSVKHLSKGVYILKMNTQNKSITKKLLIK